MPILCAKVRLFHTNQLQSPSLTQKRRYIPFAVENLNHMGKCILLMQHWKVSVEENLPIGRKNSAGIESY